jgi:type IV pilus assembly protein PilA
MKRSKGVTRLQIVRDMLAKRRNAEGSEGGFTLIELMVVLLIMAILLAIAIPTFLGVTAGAKTTAAQSDLTNALITAKTVYQKTGQFTDNKSPTTTGLPATTVKKLKAEDPAITFSTNGLPAQGQASISVYVVSKTAIVMVAADANTGCWIVADNESSSGVALTGHTPAAFPGGESYGWMKYSSTAGTTCKAGTPLLHTKMLAAYSLTTHTGYNTTTPATSTGPIGWTQTSFATLGKTLP